MALDLDDIRQLFREHGAMAYAGEPVTQLEHALQSAALAEADGAPAPVVEPIRLHVEAKRALCSLQPAYYDALSQDSRRSLALQGGIFSPAETQNFLAKPHSGDALRLRRWDDSAKVAGAPTPPLEHFLDIASRCTT